MNNSDKYSIICSSLYETEQLAKKFAGAVYKNDGAFVSMSGITGAGKTTFTKFVCRYLDVQENVTSPSFVILNEYKTGKLPVYHFDLYRLENEGVSTIINELAEYSEGKFLTIAEWAEFSENNLPFDRIELSIKYTNETEREFTFSASGKKSSLILSELKSI